MDHILKKQAVDFREKYKIKKYDAIKYFELIKALGVVTVFLPGANSNISGMALKTDNHHFMMINSDMSIGRQNFTICHKLYHLFVQDNFTSASCKTADFNKKDKIEYAADLFAMYLMMPEDRIYASIPEEELEEKKISMKTIFELERYFQCSHKALVYRLYNLNIITKEQWSELRDIQKIGNMAHDLGFDSALYKKGNDKVVLGNYEELARKAYDSEKISESHYISLLQDILIEV